MKNKRVSWLVLFGTGLCLLSLAIFFIHYLIFRDAHHIFIYLVYDLGILPLDVLIVTLILDKLLKRREKRALLKKLNMIIGVFFSEVGSILLQRFREFDTDPSLLVDTLSVSGNLSIKELKTLKKRLSEHTYTAAVRKGDLKGLKTFLVSKREFLVRLLENPNLLEHDAFTNLLWAVFHLTEELSNRNDLRKLPDSDCNHLAGDIKRAYQRLALEWVEYMAHLRKDYPYLFSLALRTNPFNDKASVIVEE